MSIVKVSIICVTAAIIFALVQGQTEVPVEPNCLGCLCEASTKCNTSSACHTPYAGAYFCGPFLISWAYWSDAGKPVIQNDNPEIQGAFENCVNDLYCAAETVRLYMAKFGQDCTGDGKITCDDFTRIHKIGYGGCTAAIRAEDPFWQSYAQCTARLSVQ